MMGDSECGHRARNQRGNRAGDAARKARSCQVPGHVPLLAFKRNEGGRGWFLVVAPSVFPVSALSAGCKIPVARMERSAIRVSRKLFDAPAFRFAACGLHFFALPNEQ